MIICLIVGIGTLMTGADPIQVTEISVVFSAVALPLTYLPILIVANDPHYMGEHDAPIKVDPATAQIFKLPAMVNPGVYPKPIPFGGMGKPVNQNGFSDHFPLSMAVTEVD